MNREGMIVSAGQLDLSDEATLLRETKTCEGFEHSTGPSNTVQHSVAHYQESASHKTILLELRIAMRVCSEKFARLAHSLDEIVNNMGHDKSSSEWYRGPLARWVMRRTPVCSILDD